MKILILVFFAIVFSFLNLESLYAEELASPEKTIIRFPSQVKVARRKLVSLYDIAQVDGMNREIAQELSGLVLIDSPKSQKYEFESYRLVQMLKDNVKKAQFTIPTKMQVEVVETALDKGELERKILNQLNSICRNCDFSITSLQIPEVRTSEVEIDFEKLPLRGSFMLPLTERMAQSSQTKWITGQLKTLKDMPVLAHSVMSGQKIQSEDIKWVKVDVSFIKDVDIKVESFYGLEAVRNLNAGAVLNWNDYKREMVVKRGQLLKAISGSEEFEVSIGVTAEENGFVGDRIRVKNGDSNRVLTAEILDAGSVRIK